MRREISTPYSFTEKVLHNIFMFFSIPLFGALDFNQVNFWDSLFAALLTVYGVVLIKKKFTYRKIETDETGLYISQKILGQNKEVFIPFNEIAQIQEVSNIHSRNEFYVIKLKTFTRFGNEIKFIPKSKFIEYPENAVIIELKEQVSRINSLPPIKMQNP